MFGSFPHPHCETRGKPETRNEKCWSLKTSISCETSGNFDTLEKESFCSFRHRHGEARGKPETRNEKCWRRMHFVRDCLQCWHCDTFEDMLELQNEHYTRDCLQCWHCDIFEDMLELQNEHCMRDCLQFWRFDTFEKERFCSFSHRYGEARDPRRDMQEQQNEHFVHHTSKVLRQPRKMKMDTSKVLRLPRKYISHLLTPSQKFCACHLIQNDCRHVYTKHVSIPITLETSKNDHCCGTSHKHGNFPPRRSLAVACGRRLGAPPDPQNVKREPLATHWEKNWSFKHKQARFMMKFGGKIVLHWCFAIPFDQQRNLKSAQDLHLCDPLQLRSSYSCSLWSSDEECGGGMRRNIFLLAQQCAKTGVPTSLVKNLFKCHQRNLKHRQLSLSFRSKTLELPVAIKGKSKNRMRYSHRSSSSWHHLGQSFASAAQGSQDPCSGQPKEWS